MIKKDHDTAYITCDNCKFKFAFSKFVLNQMIDPHLPCPKCERENVDTLARYEENHD